MNGVCIILVCVAGNDGDLEYGDDSGGGNAVRGTCSGFAVLHWFTTWFCGEATVNPVLSITVRNDGELLVASSSHSSFSASATSTVRRASLDARSASINARSASIDARWASSIRRSSVWVTASRATFNLTWLSCRLRLLTDSVVEREAEVGTP